jgi:XTP/dITP diphosphohydrolase
VSGPDASLGDGPLRPLPPLTRVVVASANPDKVAEMDEVLRAVLPHVVLVARPADVPEVIEDADTLVGNALLKAIALARATGLPAVADDTGLFVDALGGDPGVFTARYAGPTATYADNSDKLLRELRRVDATRPEQRRAAFRTAIVLHWPAGTDSVGTDGRTGSVEVVAHGEVLGTIAHEARGSAGFGYDPVFAPLEDDGRTFAELGTERKHQLSHRARALRALAEELRARGVDVASR